MTSSLVSSPMCNWCDYEGGVSGFKAPCRSQDTLTNSSEVKGKGDQEATKAQVNSAPGARDRICC